ncbi:helix-turn-helix domain-containing protein [Christensenella sp. MSJ-20]|uniref:helix-turn-helix domain-containing protein n=1 Tax=Christensenella sp. MSJ-20 TaxID=2841518 RepID=UPI001C755AD3|nr:helix-turn-helix domain-containing protein [Christensenella sp. MSJ-20]
MISYAPFFQTLLDRNVTVYYLVFKQGMSSNTFQRMREGEPITTATIDTLCSILRCTVSDIIEYQEDH